MKVHGVDTHQELISAFYFFLDDKHNIHIPSPESGGLEDALIALTSRSSMNRFATIGLIGDPMAATCTCS